VTQVYDHELVNWDESSIPTAVVDGVRWAVKPRGRREALGYHLAKGRLNVPEVRLLPQVEGPPKALVRFTKSHRVDDLPIRDLDEAVAAELAFSLWIRRRDTHAYNRAYVDGIPMFFDHGAAFNVSQELDGFLRDGPDYGFVPAWRVEEWAYEPTTLGTRWLNDATDLAIHPVHDLARFRSFFAAWVDRLAGQRAGVIDEALTASGVGAKRFDLLRGFLRRSQRELPEVARRTLELLAVPTMVGGR